MADALGSLVVSLLAETVVFRTEMERATASVNTTAASVLTASNAMTASFAKVDASLATLGVSFKSLLGFAAGAGFGEIIKSSLDATVEMGHLAEKAGMTVEAFSSLSAAAKLSKTPIEDVAAASEKFSKNLAGALDGTGKTADAMRSLGFSAQDAARFLAQPATGLFELGKRLNEFGESGTKAAAAQELIGKAGANLLPFLRQLGEQTGLTAKVFADQVETAKQATDALTRIQMASSSAGRSMAIELAPTVTGIANAFLTLNSNGKDSIGFFSAVGDAARVAALGILTVWTGVQNIGGTFVAIGKAIYDAAHGDIAKAQADMDAGAAANTQRVRNLAEAYGELQKTSPFLSMLAGRHVEAAAAAKTHADKTLELSAAMKTAVAPSVDFLNSLQKQVDTFGLSASALIRYNAALLGLAPSVVDPYIEELEALNRAADAQKSAVKAASDEWKAYVDEQKALSEGVAETDKWFNDLYESLKRDTATMGMSNAERQKTIALLELEAKTLDRTSAGYQAERDALIAAFDNKALAQGAVDSANAANRAWLDTAHTIESALTNALMSGFKKGQDYGQMLRDSLEAMFKKLVLQPTISAIVSGSASASGGGGSGIGLGSFSNAFGSGFSLSNNTWSSATSGMGPPDSSGAMSQTYGDMGSNAAGGAMAGAGMGALAAQLFGNDRNKAGIQMGATIGGAIGSIWGPIGTLVGTALGALVGSLIKSGGGPKEGGFSSTQSDVGRYFTPSTQDSTTLSLVNGIQSTFNSTLAQLGGTGKGGFAVGFDSDPKGTAANRAQVGAFVDGQQVYSYNSGDKALGTDPKRLQDALALESQRALLAALQASSFPSALASILTSVTAATATADQITRTIAFATSYKTLADIIARNPLDDALKAIAVSSQGATGALQTQASALRQMLPAFDGSTAQVLALTDATKQFYTQEVAILAQTRQVSAALSGLFSDTIKSFTLQTLDNKGKNSYYRDDEARLREQLAASTNPDDIKSITEQIVADFNAAFGLLSDADKARQLEDYKTGLAAVQAAAAERLKAVEETTKATVTTLLPLIQKAILDGALATQAAADTMQAAADQMSEPQEVDIVFTANIPGTAEVNG